MISILGAGPGNIKYLTLEAYEAIKNADKVIAFGRIGESISSLRSDIIKIDRVLELEKILKEEKDILVVASGDPLFFGITNFIKRNNYSIDRIYPGISSFQYLTSKLQKPWQDAYLFSVHGREFDLKTLVDKPISIGLVDKKHSPNWISNELKKMNLSGKITVGSYLSYETEKICEGKIGDVFENNEDLSVMVIEIDMD